MQFSDLFYIDSTGYHVSDYPTVLAWLTTAYQGIYGADVQLTPDTQDGQWIAIQALALYQAGMLGAADYNSFAPTTAQGVGLSRLVKINGISRRVPTNSTVDLVIVGQVGTGIANGVAVDTLQQQWLLPTSVTIPPAGTITVTATAQNVGAIAAAENTVTGIFTPTNGWQTVNNPTAATLGVPVETDAQLRVRQTQSVANPSSSIFDGTVGAVENVTGVSDVQGYENDTGTTDGNGIPAHSISIVAAGGDDVAIAQAIAVHKGPGCGTYGTTSETVLDSRGMPSTINFYRPTQKVVDVAIDISVTTGYTDSFATQIAQAIAAYINGLGIGTDVLITKLYVPANLPGTPAGETFDITSLLIAFDPSTPAGSNLTIAFNEIAFCDAVANVSVTVV